MKPLFPVFDKPGGDAKDLSSENIFASKFQYTETNLMRITHFHQKFYSAGIG